MYTPGRGTGYKYPAGLRRTASPHWWTFLLAIETGSAVPQTQFIDRAVVLQGVLRGRTQSANCADTAVILVVVGKFFFGRADAGKLRIWFPLRCVQRP